MGDINDSYFDWSEEQNKKRKAEIEEMKLYLGNLSFEEKVEIMFKQFTSDEISRIWKKYQRNY